MAAPSSDHGRIAAGALRVAVFLLLAKGVGALKEMALAWRYGVSEVVDAYQFTQVMASWLPVTLVGALSVVLIPVLVRLRDAPPAEQSAFLGQLHGSLALLGLVLTAGLALAWPTVLELTAGALSPAVRQMSARFMWAFAPAALLIVLVGLSAARLRARERHINTVLDSVPAGVILLWILSSGPQAGIGPLLWGSLVGYVLQAAVLLWLANRADPAPWRPQLRWSAPQWSGLLSAAGIFLLGQLAMSLVGPIDQFTAARLGENANAVLGYAGRLLSLVLGLGAVSVGRAALPVLADIQRRGDGARGRRLALRWSAAMLGVGALATLVGAWLAPWGVALLFERGAFTAQDTHQVAGVLRWGLLQLPFYFGVLVLVQLLASQGRYRVMAGIALCNFALKAVLNPLLAPLMGIAGVMLATVLMYAASFTCYWLAAWRGTVADHPPAQTP